MLTPNQNVKNPKTARGICVAPNVVLFPPPDLFSVSCSPRCFDAQPQTRLDNNNNELENLNSISKVGKNVFCPLLYHSDSNFFIFSFPIPSRPASHDTCRHNSCPHAHLWTLGCYIWSPCAAGTDSAVSWRRPIRRTCVCRCCLPRTWGRWTDSLDRGPLGLPRSGSVPARALWMVVIFRVSI